MRISYWSSDVCSSDLVPLGTGWCWARCPRGATRCGTSGQAQGTSRCPQASERIDCSGLNDRKSSNDGKEAVHLHALYPVLTRENRGGASQRSISPGKGPRSTVSLPNHTGKDYTSQGSYTCTHTNT